MKIPHFSIRVLGVCAVATVAIAAVAMVSARDSRASEAPRYRLADRTTWDSVYSADQATRGESLYVKSCARCHKESLGGGDDASPLVGSGFLSNWNGLFVSDLHDRIRKTMPSDSVGIYDRQLVTDVIAYLLKMNGFPAGAAALPKELDSLKAITIKSSKP